MKDGSLPVELPYWEFFDTPNPHVVLNDGSMTTAFEVTPLDIECFDEARTNQLTIGLRSFLGTLPDGLTLQVCVRSLNDFESIIDTHDELRSECTPFLQTVDKARVENLRLLATGSQLFRTRIFISVKSEPAAKPKAFSISGPKRFAKEFADNYEERTQTLFQACQSARGLLDALGFSTRTLSTEVFTELIYSYLNPNRASAIGAPRISPRISAEGDSPRAQLVFGDLILDDSEFVLDNQVTRVLSLKTLPEMTFAGMMSGFLSLPFKFDLMLSFSVPEQSKEMRALEQKRRLAHSLANSTSNRVGDLESESRLSQTTDLIRELIDTGQKIFVAQLIVVIRDDADNDGRKRLSQRSREVLARFKSLSGSEGMQETVGSWKIFKSDLPLAPIKLVRGKRMKAHNLVDFLPLFGSSQGDEKPMSLVGTRAGSLYSIDPYSPRLSNFNICCTGASGSGKSFAANTLTLSQIARGAKLFVIDVGGSYRKMTKLLGGQYFEINLSDRYAINPFDLSDPSMPPSGDRLKSLVSVIEQMIVDPGEKLSRLDRVQIEETLSQCFEYSRAKCEPKSPTLSEFAKLCRESKDENLVRISKLLFPWIGASPFGKLLDREGRIDADSPVVAFDLKGLSQYPDLQSVMILILTNFILDQVEKDKSVPKRVVLDEAWELLKSPAAAAFMEYAARTFRKTGSGITFITQGIEEIISSGIGPAILNNTATKLVMLQKGDTKALKENLKLNARELKLIQSLEQRKGVFSEGFLISGEERQIVRFAPSPLEYWISTSDARDNQFLEKLQQEMSLEEAVLEAARVAPLGVSQMQELKHVA